MEERFSFCKFFQGYTMQVANHASANLMLSYAQHKTDKQEEIVSRFMDIESQKIDEAELVMRSKTDALQSQVEQMKKEYIDGYYEIRDPRYGRRFDSLLSYEDMEQKYPTHTRAANALNKDKSNRTEYVEFYYNERHRYDDPFENATYQYNKEDFKKSLDNIEQIITQVLEQEFEKDPTSDYTQILMLFKVEVQSIPDIFEREKQRIMQLGKEKDAHWASLDKEYDFIIEGEIYKLHETVTRVGNAHPEFQQQLDDSVRIAFDYFHSSFLDSFNLVDPEDWEILGEEFFLILSSHFSFVDNTETLLNLAADSSSLQTNNRESKSNEALIDRIRSKLKTTDDSILQQVMSKITNGVKTNGIGEGA